MSNVASTSVLIWFSLQEYVFTFSYFRLSIEFRKVIPTNARIQGLSLIHI